MKTFTLSGVFDRFHKERFAVSGELNEQETLDLILTTFKKTTDDFEKKMSVMKSIENLIKSGVSPKNPTIMDALSMLGK